MGKTLIPNALTSSKLVFGFCSIISTHQGDLFWGSVFMLLALVAYNFCLHAFGWFGWVVAICFAVCGMLRLARFNVNAAVVHGYFMGLAIPAGGCFIATSTLLMRGIGFDPMTLGWIYPIVMLIVGFDMYSTIHYPDFKGKGEKVYLATKVISALVFSAHISCSVLLILQLQRLAAADVSVMIQRGGFSS